MQNCGWISETKYYVKESQTEKWTNYMILLIWGIKEPQFFHKDSIWTHSGLEQVMLKCRFSIISFHCEMTLSHKTHSEKAMAPHSSTLAWKIPWTEEPGRLQSVRSRRVGHGWVTSLSLFTFMHWRRNGNPPQCSCLENPRDGGAWWAAVYGVAQSRTRLKWLSSSSSSIELIIFFLKLRGNNLKTIYSLYSSM